MTNSRRYEQLREEAGMSFEAIKAQRRLRALVGKPSPNKTKPWKAEHISRAKWYQRRAQRSR